MPPDKSYEENLLFEKNYKKYYYKIYNYIFHALFNKEIAEDLTSKTFLNALKYIKKNNPKIQNFNAWIYKIASNEIISYKNKKRNKVEINSFEEDINEIQKFLNNDNSDHIEKFSNFLIIEKAINKLKPKEKAIITLFYYENMTYSEISKILDIKENSLRPTMFRILKKMKKTLRKIYNDYL